MTPGCEPDYLERILAAVAARFTAAPAATDTLATGLPWLDLIRRRHAAPAGHGILQPSACLLLQGAKQLLVGERLLAYGPGTYVQSGIAVPAAGAIIEASAERPYYALRIGLDPVEMAAFLLEMRMAPPAAREDALLVTVEPAGAHLLEALLRLMDTLERPRDLPVLGRLLRQEILYHLLMAPGGAVLAQGLHGSRRERAVGQAIAWIRDHYDQPLRIAALAQAVNLSPSVLHRRFKAATVMSPLQYQKQVRLLEARKLLMGGKAEAASIAYRVGYESPSHFSREYRRLFGATPMQDARQLRGDGGEP